MPHPAHPGALLDIASFQRRSCLLLNAGHGVGPQLAAALAEHSCRVVAAAAQPPADLRDAAVIWTDPAPVAMLAAKRGPFDTIIFNAPAHDEETLTDAEDGGT